VKSWTSHLIFTTTHICSKMFLSLSLCGQYSKDRNTSHKEHIFYPLLSATKRGATFPFMYVCKLPFPLCLVELSIMNIHIRKNNLQMKHASFLFAEVKTHTRTNAEISSSVDRDNPWINLFCAARRLEENKNIRV
jgi:hypothetical protein